MALQVNFLLPAGSELASLQTDAKIQSFKYSEDYEVTNGYAYIDSMNGNKNLLMIDVLFKKAQNSTLILKKESYAFVPDVSTPGTENFYTQGYNFLKTLVEFYGAIDVLEVGQNLE